MLNRIYKFTDKQLAICHWGSRSIKHEFDWLRRIIPNLWGGLQELKKALELMELDPTLAHHSSLWGLEYSYLLRKPPLFAFANMFPGINTLYDILEPVARKSSNPINLNSNLSPETLSLSENFLVQFHTRVKKSHKTLPPLHLGETRNFRTYTIFHIILIKPYILKRCYKRYIISKYNKIPPSYQSRIRDGVDCPRNPVHFSDAYVFLGRAKIDSALKSFQLELLNRTLPSPRKLVRMGIQQDPHCVVCPGAPIASSAHTISDCTIPTFFIKFFNKFTQSYPPLAKYQLCTVVFEFSFPRLLQFTFSTEEQLHHLFIAVKQFASFAHQEPRFDRWNNLIYYARILNIAKKIIRTRTFAKLPSDILEHFLDFAIDNFNLIPFL
jgi:hypothetical protein